MAVSGRAESPKAPVQGGCCGDPGTAAWSLSFQGRGLHRACADPGGAGGTGGDVRAPSSPFLAVETAVETLLCL